MLGGAGTLLGPILGAAIITFGNEYLRVAGSLRLGLLGLAIVVTVLFFPGGIMQLVGRVRARAVHARSSDGSPREPAPVVAGDPAGVSSEGSEER
jgi:Na+-transporting methylmalonyl-CoA/oxaloacetate decarboxylase gamma subunit